MKAEKNISLPPNSTNRFFVIILALVTLLAHQTVLVCYLEGLTPIRSCTYGSAVQQLGMLLVIVLMISWTLRYEHEEKSYRQAWRRNWLLGVFIGLAFLSLLWTEYFPATIYRVLLLLFITSISAFVGMKFSARDLVNFVAITVAIAALASILLAAVLPKAAIMINYPYEGLWRGIFWHKLYLGATMALGYVAYLVILFSAGWQYSPVQKALAAIMLVVGAVLAVLSDSVSGLVVYVIQTGLFALLLVWRSRGHLLSRRAYWVLAGGSLLGLIALLSNLDYVFGFFNRSAQMTGRVPMWIHVLKTYFVTHQFFGYGFGTFWLQPGVMEDIQAVVGWVYPVRVADNGYLDVLMGLGFVGLILLLAILAVGFGRSIQMARLGGDLVYFFPLLVMVHILFINISMSYFVEQESFIWLILTIILFMRFEAPRQASAARNQTLD